MATASPCKFEAVITTALGKSRWQEYEVDHFPAQGKDMLLKKECPPILYKANPKKSLDENQIEWEQMTRSLIACLSI
jgi:hypothetical protein